MSKDNNNKDRCITEHLRCCRCGHYWNRRYIDGMPLPKICPKCKSEKYNQPMRVEVL